MPLPLIVHEDADLLVVAKPAGWNTHAPAPRAGEGLYDWLKHREPRWAHLAILHRLDKETSGLLVFGKTPLANRSLTEQFTARTVEKRYRLWTDRPVPFEERLIRSRIRRLGDRYGSVGAGLDGGRATPPPAFGHPLPIGWGEGRGEGRLSGSSSQADGGQEAETLFRVVARDGGRMLVDAFPHTGRTHQIRVHAAEGGFPILGDSLYGGSAFDRVCLHAAALSFIHPATGERIGFERDEDFSAPARLALRDAFIVPDETDAFRLIHGAADGWPEWFVEKLGPWLLSQGEADPTPARLDELKKLAARLGSHGVYHKRWNVKVRETDAAAASPRLLFGEPEPERFEIRENGVKYRLGFGEGYSVGLFLDQRDNRRRWLMNHVGAGFGSVFESKFSVQRSAFSVSETPNSELRTPNVEAPEVLNTFAYTCGFSVAAASGGARVTSLDLSKKYLDWGRDNFVANGLDPAAHDFIFGDCFDWLRRLGKKGRRYHAVILDPPTFSNSKQSGAFRVQKDFGKLVLDALIVLHPGGTLLASCNAANWPAEEFLSAVRTAVARAGRRVLAEHYVPQPADFPISREQPAYLKTCWLRIS
jgi:23S rRNA (cytosine1962-C5)-methyltransferase